jgi:LPS-assembly protein
MAVFGVRCEKKFLVLLGGLLGMFLFPGISWGEEKVILDADEVIYDEAGYSALARGNVELRYGGMRLFADHMEVDTATNLVNAYGSPQKPVTMLWGGRRLYGERIEYDLTTQEGKVYQASGRVGEIRLSGRDLQVVPVSKAREEKWASPKHLRGLSEEEEVARWDEVALTTCREAKPHYRLVAKRVVVIPGQRVIAKKPKVYIGETMLFQYPFDYVVGLGPRGSKALRANFFPSLSYKSAKGVGVGVEGPLTWDRGELDLGIMYWTDIGLEGSATLTQEITPGFFATVTSEYTYDEITEEASWRAGWGFHYSRAKWKATLNWTQREYVEIEKRAGVTYRGTLWRDPEFFVYSPWFTDAASGGWWRLIGTAGEYEEDGWNTSRKGLGLEIYGEGDPRGAFVPFWKGLYMYYGYDADRSLATEQESQKITEATLGVSWPLGDLQMRTSYVRRWVSGESPMNWDRFDEREDIYQKVSYSLQNGWGVAARGGYDNLERELKEMVYWISYETDCMTWELVYRDDRGDQDDSWAGLRISILAFPETPFGIGQEKVEIPGEIPEDLPAPPKAWQ